MGTFRTGDKGSWRGLHQVKHLFKRGVVHKVGNGELTNLWDNVWVTSAPLRACFPKIYGIYIDVNISVAQGAEMDWQFLLRRQLGPAEREECDELQELLRNVVVSGEKDEIEWGLTASKKFTTRSLYRLMTSGGCSSRFAKKLWGSRISLKICVFIWQAT
jgi:hypothetical protein